MYRITRPLRGWDDGADDPQCPPGTVPNLISGNCDAIPLPPPPPDEPPPEPAPAKPPANIPSGYVTPGGAPPSAGGGVTKASAWTDALPWLVGGAVAIGALALFASASGR